MKTNRFPKLLPSPVDLRLHGAGGTHTFACAEDAAVFLCQILRDDLRVAGAPEIEAGCRVASLIRRALLPPSPLLLFPGAEK